MCHRNIDRRDSQCRNRCDTVTIGCRGFTLIELSVVLIIVALLSGGIFVGRDLIRSARLLQLVGERSKLLTAVSSFQAKYGALPGDMSDAEAMWGTDPGGCPLTTGNPTPSNSVPKQATCNGNGDGVIGGIYNAAQGCVNNIGLYPVSTGAPDSFEMFRFWQHLANANLIWGGPMTGVAGPNAYYQQITGVNVPASAVGTVGISTWGTVNCTLLSSGFFPVFYRTLFVIGAPADDGYAQAPFLTPLEAFNIDSKYDDGRPGSGNIMTFTPDAYSNCATSDDPKNATYSFGFSDISCQLLYNEGI